MNKLIAKMNNLKPSGKLVSISELRKIAEMGDEQFDLELTILANEGVVNLFEHTNPHGLSKAERDNLLYTDGCFYNGVAVA